MSTWPRQVLKSTILAIYTAWVISAYAANAEPSPSESRAVARVFDRTITLDEISPAESAQSAFREREPENDYGTWLRDHRTHALERLIWEEATQHLLKGYELEPTRAEVESLTSFLASSQANRLNELEAERAEIGDSLSRDDLPEDRRARLEEQLAALEGRISSERVDREQRAAVPGIEERHRDASDWFARNFVRQWKVNKALYERYGGRVIFQQFGNEPIDAYRALIGELDDVEAVEILDPAFSDPFARLRAYFEMHHHYMSKEDADRYFDQPWWLQRQ